MQNSIIKKLKKAQKKGIITTTGIFLLFLTQIPIAMLSLTELFCIGQVSNSIWREQNNHSQANILAVQKCRGK